MPVRAILDRIYAASGAAAAAFLVAIGLVVLAQVGCNTVDALIKLAGGEPLGLVIPSYAEFAGFFLAATSFLALASTLRAGGHIRVLLVLHRLPARVQRIAEFWCVGAGGAVSAYFCWYTWKLAFESLQYNDLSPGIVPVPLWIPQAAMALGLSILTLAFADELASLARGRPASFHESEARSAGHG
jgi:TRAP-type C4-dicarboxylate transport system permease small subunit